MLLKPLDFSKDIEAMMRSAPMGRVGVAVSGGGDSVALLLLLADWSQAAGRDIAAVTVDHGLRADSAREAIDVGTLCADLGIPHQTVHWRDWGGQGNLQNAARQARRRLIADWAQAQDISAIVTGHTQDDQAETFLMRLARGSGVDGLAAMYPTQMVDGVLWMRPLLSVRRADLRAFLQQRGVSWVDDPSNEDERFDRIKMRKALNQLDELGLGVTVLSDTATRMQQARNALEQMTFDVANQVATPRDSGVVRLDLTGLQQAPPEVQLRLLAHAMRWVSGAEYRPRLHSLKRILAGLNDKRTQSLAGCLISPFADGVVEVAREPQAVKPTTDFAALFDGRWRVVCRLKMTPLTLRALGEDGILQRPEWRQSAESRNAVLSSPSIWCNNELISAALLDKDGPCSSTLNAGVQSFFLSILTH